MAKPNSWANIRNSDIALIRQARGLSAPDSRTSQFGNLTREDVEYIARLRGREYNPRFSPMTNLQGDDIDFIRNLRPSGQPILSQQFENSGSPYMGNPTPQTAPPVLDAVPPTPQNEGILNRLNAARRARQYPGLNTGLDPSLPGNDPTAGPIGPVNYDPVLGAPGMPRLSSPMTQDEINVYNESNRPRVTEGILQRYLRDAQTAVADWKSRTANPTAPSPTPQPQMATPTPAPQPTGFPTIPMDTAEVSPDQIMRQLIQGGAPNGGSMADARAQEIAYANSMMPQPGSMANARAQEIAYANSQPNPAARGGRGGGANVPMPPTRPAELGAQPALYMVDFGDGAPVRQYLAKDGQAPNIPGANVMLDPSYDPNAGALAKFIRGVF